MTGSNPETDKPDRRAHAMMRGRQADSARRRQRVIAALNRAATDGTVISASSIARAASVDRSFLYRHRDLLVQIHALETGPPATAAGPAVTRASLQADLLAAGERALRLTGRIRQLETRLSEALGEQAWRESGLGAPPTSTPSTRGSTTSNSRPSSCAYNSPNTTRTSPRRRQPRTHGPTQHRGATPMTRRVSRLHHTCRERYRSAISL